MDFTALTAVISIVAALSGIGLGWAGRSRAVRQEVVHEAESGATVRAGIEYIKRGVDDIRADVRMQGQRRDSVVERLTRVEESAKQAHKRIGKLEEWSE